MPRRSRSTARCSSPMARATPPAAGLPRSMPAPAASCGAGTPCRSPAIPAARPGRTSQCLAHRRRRRVADRFLRSGLPSLYLRHRRPFPTSIRNPAPATISTPFGSLALDTDTGKMVWYFQDTPNDLWDYDEVGINMLYDDHHRRRTPQGDGNFSRNGFFYSLDRNNGQFLQAATNTQRAELDQRHRRQDRQAARLRPRPRRSALVPEARSLRGDPMKRTCPTWHGGVAYQPTAYNPVKHIAYGVGAEGCFAQNGAAAAFKGPNGGLDRPRTKSAPIPAISITAPSAPTTR